ncbi:MAG: nucleoside triphosphate pyrophosphohydrolase [Methylovirgula sp.]|jgi:nucleoside triphosphate diphosphatase
MENSRDLAKLLEIMAALRTPRTGCPWDLEQNFATIAPYTIEEAYEVAEAIARGDLVDLKEELGDLLLQVVFHARMAEEQGAFDFGDVVQGLTDKLIRRHPHVFGQMRGLSAQEVKALWAKIKAEERAGREARQGLLCEVPVALPGLTRAVKLQNTAGSIGFDWDDVRLVLAKIREETDEIEVALEAKDRAAAKEEIGDLLFAVANLARHLGADPEAAVRQANHKFERRFSYIEREVAHRGATLEETSLPEMDLLWDEAKQREK